MTFAHILFPVDFSERAAGAARHVAALSKRFGSSVTLMHVVAPGWMATGTPEFAPIDYSFTERLKEELQIQLESFGKQYLDDVNWEACVEQGDPAAEIIQFAHTRAVSMIMMPSHGYGPFRRLLLGSVTAKVLHDVECPVWTGVHCDAEPDDTHLPCRSVLCAVDLSTKSSAVMHWATAFARRMDAELRFVHAVPGSEVWPERQFSQEVEADLRRAARERLTALQTETGISGPVCIGSGAVASVIEEEARRHQADLVVIGRGCIQGTLGRLRTHAYGIIRQAPCPVISL